MNKLLFLLMTKNFITLVTAESINKIPNFLNFPMDLDFLVLKMKINFKAFKFNILYSTNFTVKATEILSTITCIIVN